MDQTSAGAGAARGAATGPRHILVAAATPAFATGLRTWLAGERSRWRVQSAVGSDGDLRRILHSQAALVVATLAPTGLLPESAIPVLSTTLPVLVLADGADAIREAGLLRRGAASVVPVDVDKDRFLATVDSLLCGRSAISMGAARLLSAGTLDNARVTERQRAVLMLLARGLSNREIAQELVITPSTVKTHINRIAQKFALPGRQQLSRYAPSLLEPSEDRMDVLRESRT